MSDDGAGMPLRVAVVGSGPAAFYAAGHLLASTDPPAEVDMIERLPTPWGLVRLGVAPDHPNLKTVSRAFERIAERPGFRFFGNVEVGEDVSHAELMEHYDAVVYAVGAQTDRRLGIPGEDLPGSWAATELVAWYNGHPDFQELPFDLSGERAVVIGNGNVALDVARMLALTREELAPTDTTDAAIEAIADPGSGRSSSSGGAGRCKQPGRRRSCRRWATSPAPTSSSIRPSSSSTRRARPSSPMRPTSSSETSRSCAVSQAREPTGKPRAVRLRFRASPIAVLGDERVEAIEVARNRLEPDGKGSVRAVATDEREIIPCGIVFRSVGYRGVAVPGTPFDEASGTIPNVGGRVLDASGVPLPGVYAAGWIKRGPTGVIGTNKKDATETVDHLLEDARAGLLPPVDRPGRIEERFTERGVEIVTYPGWGAIDALERAAGEAQGRPRVKLCTWEGLLAAARGDSFHRLQSG